MFKPVLWAFIIIVVPSLNGTFGFCLCQVFMSCRNALNGGEAVISEINIKKINLLQG